MGTYASQVARCRGVAASAGGGLGQSDGCVIAGIVRDTSGGAIPGATIRVVNEKTQRTVIAVSDKEGGYRLGDLLAGTYRLESSLDGFEPAVREVTLESGQTLTIEVTVAPAQLTEGVRRHRPAGRGSGAGGADPCRS